MRDLTIFLEDDVFERLKQRVGLENISQFLNDLVKPYVVSADGKPLHKRIKVDD